MMCLRLSLECLCVSVSLCEVSVRVFVCDVCSSMYTAVCLRPLSCRPRMCELRVALTGQLWDIPKAGSLC